MRQNFARTADENIYTVGTVEVCGTVCGAVNVESH